MRARRLALTLALAVFAVACASSAPRADAAKRPSGSGWYCRTIFESDLNEEAECVRTQAECERLVPYERARDPRCRKDSSAVCFTDALGAHCYDGRWRCNYEARLARDGGRKDASECVGWD